MRLVLFMLFVLFPPGALPAPKPFTTFPGAHNSAVSKSPAEGGGHCPLRCECKWKRGKETVSCGEDAAFTSVPRVRDAGTQVLHLEGAAIAALTDDVFTAANLLNLQEVALRNCGLRTVSAFAFRDLINLVSLDLSDNLLEGIPSDALSGLPQLRELVLSGNPLGRVAGNAFSGLGQLVRLELNDCRLGWVDPRALIGLGALEWLKLGKNELTSLDESALRPLRKLHGERKAKN